MRLISAVAFLGLFTCLGLACSGSGSGGSGIGTTGSALMGLSGTTSGSSGASRATGFFMLTNGSGSGSAVTGTSTGGSASSGQTGSTSGTSGTGGTGGTSGGNVRLANLIPSTIVTLDLCLTPHGTPFTSSSLGLLQGSALGIAGGLKMGQVSAYLSVSPGSYDIVIMNGAEQDGCTLGYPTAGGPLTVPANGLTTIAMLGALDISFQAKAYSDDPGTPLPGAPMVRLVSGMNGTGVDLGSGFAQAFTVAAGDVALGGIAALAGSDANGYAPVPPGFATNIVAKQIDGPTLFIGAGFALPSGGNGSLFLLGELKGGTQSVPAIVEVCDDSAGPQASGAFSCVPLQAKAMLRLVQLIPDVGPLDLCVLNPDAGTAQVATLAGAQGGIAYGESSAYVPVPANFGFSVTSVLNVVASGAGCSASLIKLSGQSLGPATYNTLIAEGLLDGGPFVPTALLMPRDEELAPAGVIADGGVNVRFQNGAIGFSPAQGGTGPEGSQFNILFYDDFGMSPFTALTDPQGYNPGVSLVGVDFEVYDPGAPGDLVSQPSYNLPAASFVSSAVSLFFIGTGVTPQDYATLQVDDQADPVKGLLPTHP